MFISITTQVRENYGSTERGRPCWKNKFGSTYLLEVRLAAIAGAENRQHFLADLVKEASYAVAKDTPMIQEWIISWELVEDDHLTSEELDQLQFDGYIHEWSHMLQLPAQPPRPLSEVLPRTSAARA